MSGAVQALATPDEQRRQRGHTGAGWAVGGPAASLARRPLRPPFDQPEHLRRAMYAIIKTGGKQYRVKSGEQVRVESLAADVGAAVSFDQVLAVGEGDAVRVGAPLVAGAQVKATVVAHGRGEKVKIFKMRRRKHYQKTQGHRQNYTEVRIDDIVGAA